METLLLTMHKKVRYSKPKSRPDSPMSEDEQMFSFEIQRNIKENIIRSFDKKYLAHNFVDMLNTGVIIPEQLVIAPPAYDTAWYIKATRKGLGKSSTTIPIQRKVMGANGKMIKTSQQYPSWYNKKTERVVRGSIIHKGYSYAYELNKYGSEFEVFKKKQGLPPNLAKKSIAQLGLAHLERVKVKPHNHRGFITQAIYDSVWQFVKNHKDIVEKVKIWLPM